MPYILSLNPDRLNTYSNTKRFIEHGMVSGLAYVSQALTPLQRVDIATAHANSLFIKVGRALMFWPRAANRVLSAHPGKLPKAMTNDHPH